MTHGTVSYEWNCAQMSLVIALSRTRIRSEIGITLAWAICRRYRVAVVTLIDNGTSIGTTCTEQ